MQISHYNSVLHFLIDFAILGCDVSEKSIRAVRQVFQDIGPKLNLSANPLIRNYPPVIVKQYLATNHLKRCVLVVDAETVKASYGNLSHRKDEYEDLLNTAAEEVGKIGFYPWNEKKRFCFLLAVSQVGRQCVSSLPSPHAGCTPSRRVLCQLFTISKLFNYATLPS